MFGIGPLCGTKILASPRFTVTTKSPQTDIFGDSNCGGFFGPELRWAGISQLVITGQHDTPVYLSIHDDDIQIKDAKHLWGKQNLETQALIRKELEDPKVQIVNIGPAGEKLVRFAAIMNTTHNYAARSGVGAVMGSKNLKAVAVRGTQKVEVPHPEEYAAAWKALNALVKQSANPDFITLDSLERAVPKGYMPVRGNLGKTHLWDYAYELGGKLFRKEFATRRTGCYNCTIRCKRSYEVKEGKYAGTKSGGPEFSVTAYTPVLDLREMEPVLHMNMLLNEYGIDCSSFLQMATWASECYEHGIITEEDTGGLNLTWGNSDAIIQLIHQVAHREGFGDIIAEGEKRAPQIIQRNSADYSYHIKGLSLVSDPRIRKYWGLAMMTNTRGGEHLRASYSPTAIPKDFAKKYIPDISNLNDPDITEGKGKGLRWTENWVAFISSIGLCMFVWHPTGNAGLPFIQAPDLLVKALTATTGIPFTLEEVLTAGDRIFNIEKAFNTREGLTRADDLFTRQQSLADEPIRDGPGKGLVFKPEKMLDEYYGARGWDVQTSLPTRKTLTDLGLDDIADKLNHL